MSRRRTPGRAIGRQRPKSRRPPPIEERVVGIELYTPHEGQWRLHQSTARFRICCCGRRWGKTTGAANDLAKFVWEHPVTTIGGVSKPTVTWWVAPTYNQTRYAFNVVTTMFADAIRSKKEAIGQMRVVWMNGATTEFQSAERYDNLRGEGVSYMIVDEAAMVSRAAWENVLRPMLTDTMGQALLISTPRGKNWFYALYRRGEDAEQTDYEAFSFPTVSSPFVADSEVEEARETLPGDVFAQEYLGAFLDEAAGVFHCIEDCIFGEFEEPRHDEHHRYVIGWDIAKHTDWSVISVLDCDHGREDRGSIPHLAHFERFNTLNYAAQIDRVAAVARKYSTYVLLDSTGLGDPIYDMMQAKGIPCFPFTFTNRSKMQIIQNLAVAMQVAGVSFPEIPVLLQELAAYQYTIGPSGQIRYAAPEGDHDDCVVSLALALWAAHHPVWNQEPRIALVDDEMISPV